MSEYPEKRALLVDDDEYYLESTSSILRSEGVECSRLYTGENALLFLETLSFRLLIVEEHLPGVNGLEVAAVARKLHRSVPIIITTTSSTSAGIREAALIGAFEYVVKPFDASWMRSKISQSLMKSFVPPRHGQKKRTGHSTIPASPSRRALHKKSLDIIVVEPDDGVRGMIIEAAANIGCKVSAFKTVDKAAAQSRIIGFDVLIARPNIIRMSDLWTPTHDGRSPLGAVAIINEKASRPEALSTRAKGMISLDDEAKQVGAKLRLIMSQIVMDRDSVPPPPKDK